MCAVKNDVLIIIRFAAAMPDHYSIQAKLHELPAHDEISETNFSPPLPLRKIWSSQFYL